LVIAHPATRDLRVLPKAHLHLHLDGAIRPETLRELCDERGIEVPEPPADRAYGSFAAFMATIQATHALLRDHAALSRVVREVIDDNASDGAVWVEISVWPGVFGSRDGGRMALETILAEGHAAAEDRGIAFGLMVAANRHEGPEVALAVERLAAELRDDGVVSFGLDGDETVNPPESFAVAFGRARDDGLRRTPHAGELRGADSVRAAIAALDPDRILHGVRSIEDPSLVSSLADSGVCLDVCPTSNVKLSVVPDLASHPLPKLLEAGVRCSLNADDPGLFGTSLLNEYEAARAEMGLDDAAIGGIAATSLANSGLDEISKRTSIAEVASWLGAVH
jgi:adenosine deaminase